MIYRHARTDGTYNHEFVLEPQRRVQFGAWGVGHVLYAPMPPRMGRKFEFPGPATESTVTIPREINVQFGSCSPKGPGGMRRNELPPPRSTLENLVNMICLSAIEVSWLSMLDVEESRCCKVGELSVEYAGCRRIEVLQGRWVIWKMMAASWSNLYYNFTVQ